MPEPRTFTARLDCHYLLDAPAETPARPLLVSALHGFGSNAEVMLRLSRSMLGPAPVIASIEAPSQFYTSSGADSQIGFSWGTRAHWSESVRLHHDMVRHVLDEAGTRFGIGPERRVLLGFSQPVGLNYRFAATYPDEVRGVIGICGGVPRDWEDGGNYQSVRAALLHIARIEDEFYPRAVAEKFPRRLRHRAASVEFHMLEGGHRFPSKAGPIVERWLGTL
jgi:predicted esterase